MIAPTMLWLQKKIPVTIRMIPIMSGARTAVSFSLIVLMTLKQLQQGRYSKAIVISSNSKQINQWKKPTLPNLNKPKNIKIPAR